MTSRTILKSAAAVPALALGYVVGQIYRAGHRKDLPSHQNQDPTGTFGDQSHPRLLVVALGDSSVTCPGVQELDECYVRRVAIHLSERFFVELVSVAVGGSKASDVLAEQLQPATALGPDLAIVSVGANDAIRGTPVTSFEADLTKIVSRLHSTGAAVAALGIGNLGTIPRLPRALKPLLNWRARRIDGATQRVVDQFERASKSENWTWMAEAFENGDRGLWAHDEFHASGRGHAVFARGVIPAIDELVPGLLGERG